MSVRWDYVLYISKLSNPWAPSGPSHPTTLQLSLGHLSWPGGKGWCGRQWTRGCERVRSQIRCILTLFNTYLSLHILTFLSETISVKSKGEIAARYGRIFACLIITRTRLPTVLKNARKLSFVRRDFCFEWLSLIKFSCRNNKGPTLPDSRPERSSS